MVTRRPVVASNSPSADRVGRCCGDLFVMLPVGFDPMGIFFEVTRDSEADRPARWQGVLRLRLGSVVVAFLSEVPLWV